MSNAITPFVFGDSLVRTMLDENNNPWFVAKDVCAVLELGNYRTSIALLDEDEKADVHTMDVSSNGTVQGRKMTTISESGLYSLIFKSRKKEAKSFRKWVTSEVLPSLRKTGSYHIGGASTSSVSSVHISSGAENPLVSTSLQLTDYPITEDAKYIRPNLRQRIWQDAVQTARLDNGSSGDALRWFGYLCKMMREAPKALSPDQRIRDFYFQCVEVAEGSRVKSYVFYEAFCKWFRKTSEIGEDVPSHKMFTLTMQEFAKTIRSDGTFFLDIRIK